MPLNKHNWIMAIAIDFILSLLHVASALPVFFGIPQEVMHHEITFVCASFLFSYSNAHVACQPLCVLYYQNT